MVIPLYLVSQQIHSVCYILGTEDIAEKKTNCKNLCSCAVFTKEVDDNTTSESDKYYKINSSKCRLRVLEGGLQFKYGDREGLIEREVTFEFYKSQPEKEA